VIDIRVPNHIRKGIPLVDQMLRMLEEYKKVSQESKESEVKLIIDPVEKFLTSCILRKEGQSEEEYKSIINYLIRLFYSVKGTKLVVDYIGKYLPSFASNIKYSTNSIVIELNEDMEVLEQTLFVDDPSSFRRDFVSFLDSLLYYNGASGKSEGSSDIVMKGSVTLIVKSHLDSYSSTEILTYKLFDITTQEIYE
jgi:hypothetical protein